MGKERNKHRKERIRGKKFRYGAHYSKPPRPWTVNDLKEGECVKLIETESMLLICGRGV